MNVLVIGNGGREHAVIQALKKSPKVTKLYAMKGNAGIAKDAELVNVDYCNVKAVGDWVDQKGDIDFTVVTPDDPLALGLVDELESRGHRAFGPKKNAAIIEASKAFSKELMKKYGIPTASYETFDDYALAVEYVKKCNIPVVLKADGLALGKGVLICKTREEALQGLAEMMLDQKFGSAGNKVVVEEFLEGPEVSCLAFTDGKTIKPMITSCDHKRALDNDEGLNTGGMGTFSPAPFFGEKSAKEVMEKIMQPTVSAMNAEGRPFKGVLYFGLMKTKDGYKVIEYNARFGDPETQVILPMLKTDLLEIFEAIVDERLNEVEIEWEKGACVCLVLASGGYPEKYEKGKEIVIGDLDKDVILCHAGTAEKDGRLVTSGGRVLGVCAKGEDVEAARNKVYANAEKICFDGMYYRKDIGIKYREIAKE
ncbi:MAG: phosphoribosylamine--glycine ligase [Clostridiales bacterium]|nr:phosphoribosylamine--glycine ligase [Clostridiales bacterium]